MRLFTILAAFALATALSSVAAKADFYAGPIQNGNQCWKLNAHSSPSQTWGYWTACPAPAAAPAPAKHSRHRR